MKYAKRDHQTLLDEIEELRGRMQTETQCGPGLEYACNRYVVVSKEVIRKVSFTLCRAVLP